MVEDVKNPDWFIMNNLTKTIIGASVATAALVSEIRKAVMKSKPVRQAARRVVKVTTTGTAKRTTAKRGKRPVN
jgi:hypothetical protein